MLHLYRTISTVRSTVSTVGSMGPQPKELPNIFGSDVHLTILLVIYVPYNPPHNIPTGITLKTIFSKAKGGGGAGHTGHIK